MNNVFEEKIKPILLYVGTIVAVIMSIAYVVVVFVLINGFKSEALMQTTVFGIVNAAVGFCIMQMLKIQGQSFAANIDENKIVAKEYFETQAKEKKLHSMRFYWITSISKDLFFKCLSLALTTIGLIYIMIEGSNDYNLLLLAFVNLLMFFGFGLVSLVNTYDFYNNIYVNFMKQKIKERKNDNNKRCELSQSGRTSTEESE